MALPQLSLSLQFALDKSEAKALRSTVTRSMVNRALRHSLARLGADGEGLDGEITVRIVGADEGQSLNKAFRGKDYATNVLTFDYAKSPVVHADLVLCAPVIKAEAKAQKISLAAHYTHMLVHGCLHAGGYDHETSSEDAEEMERLESAILAGLGIRSPYGH